MAVVHQQLSILLPRLLSLKDSSPFILVLEDILQSSYHFMKEFLFQIPKDTNTILLRMEDFNMKGYQFSHTIDGAKEGLADLKQKIASLIVENKKNLIFVDSLNQVPPDQLSGFLLGLLRPGCTLVGVYNDSLRNYEEIPELYRKTYYPKAETLLDYFSTTKIVLEPCIERTNTMSKIDIQRLIDARHTESLTFSIPLNCNRSTFWVELEHRRRSGRSLKAKFSICSDTHRIEYLKPQDEDRSSEDSSVLQGLATFNLNTTKEQKEAKEQVMLPYLEAQELGNGGAAGGAIVYEYEKDDDYDEEDPYEDPF